MRNFKYWIDGQILYGDYFTHTLDYWCHRFDDNFQHLVYEEMKSKPKESVLKIAKFLGKGFVDKLTKNNELVLNKVLEMSSFESMSCQSNAYKFWVRKGIVGDWRSHLNERESDLIDRKVEELFRGTGIEDLRTSDMKL